MGTGLPEDAPGFDRIRRSQTLTVTVSDPVLAPKSIDVAGTTTLADVKVNGTLTAREKPVAIQGAGVVVYDVEVTSTVTLQTTAPTDGFVLVQVEPDPIGSVSLGLARLQSGDVELQTWSGTLSMPVHKGATWTFFGAKRNVNGPPKQVRMQLFWFPAGGSV